MPVLVALVLSLHALKVKEHSFLLGGRSEVKLHAGVMAVLKAGLSLRHPVVELAIEVGQTFLIQLASIHAVLEDYTASCLLVEVLLIDLFGLEPDSVDSHLVLGGGSRRVQVIRASKHFCLLLFINF